MHQTYSKKEAAFMKLIMIITKIFKKGGERA